MRARSAKADRRHASPSRSLTRARDGSLDGLELGRLERPQPVGEPRRAAGANATHDPLTVVREPETDATSIVGRAHALEEPGALQPIDVSRHRRGRDPLLGGELGKRQAGAPLHEPEECRLPGSDAELLGLLAELAREPKEHWAQVRRDGLGTKHNLINH